MMSCVKTASPTAGVREAPCGYAPAGYWWARRDATLTEPTPRHTNCLKTRRLPPVGCTTVGWGHSISQKKQVGGESILPNGQTNKPYVSRGEP